MKRRMLSLLLTVVMLFSFAATAFAADTNTTVTVTTTLDRANALKDLGLFMGSGTGFDLDRAPTRGESIIMLLRMLGKAEEAQNSSYQNPFTDVPAWASKYIAYAYAKGYTSGTSKTTFGANNLITPEQFLTFMLRALGYNDKTGDFNVSTAIQKAESLKLVVVGKYKAGSKTFYRSDCVEIIYSVLGARTKWLRHISLWSKLTAFCAIILDMLIREDNESIKTKPKYTIKQIFADHWYLFLLAYPNLIIRHAVLSNVNKILKCQTPALGFTTFCCKKCGTIQKVFHTCKSRFCNSCGIKYAKERATAISAKCINCRHRHLVFTIPEELRVFFRKDRDLLNVLFDAASQTILSWFHDLNKSQDFRPGIICVLHTFGRDLKWNPHIHALCTEGGLGNIEVFRHVRHIDYTALRMRFQTILLNMLEHKLGKENFRPIKNKIYANNKNGFYVRAKPNKCGGIKEGIKYVVRYTGRPVYGSIQNYQL